MKRVQPDEKLSDEELLEKSIKQAHEATAGNDIFNIMCGLPLHAYRKAHLDEAMALDDLLKVGITSDIWEGESALIVMGSDEINIEGERASNGLMSIVSPMQGNKLICFRGNLLGHEDTEGYIFYGGEHGLKVIPIGFTGAQVVERPVLRVENGLDLPDEIQAFLSRGYDKKARLLLQNILFLEQELIDQFYTLPCEEAFSLIIKGLGLTEETIEGSMLIGRLRKIFYRQHQLHQT